MHRRIRGVVLLSVFMATLGMSSVLAGARYGLNDARKLAPILARRHGMIEQGLGLLVVRIRLDDRSRFRKEPLDAFDLELTPSLGGAPQRFAMPPSGTAVATLPAGRYCISAVFRSGARFEAECGPPYLDVTAKSVDTTGLVDITLRRRKADVTDRELDVLNAASDLTVEQQATIRRYLAEAVGRGMRTFLFSAPPGLTNITRLYPDGVAETQEYSLANATYDRGSWRQDGEALVLSFDSGNTVTRITHEHDAWFAVETHRTQIDPYPIVSFSERQLAVARDIRCWHWSRCGQRFRGDVVMTADYSWVADRARLVGRIELEFGLALEHGIAKPRDVKVIATTLSTKVARDVAEQFADTQYDARRVPAERDRRVRTTVDFSVAGNELTSRMGPLRSVTAE